MARLSPAVAGGDLSPGHRAVAHTAGFRPLGRRPGALHSGDLYRWLCAGRGRSAPPAPGYHPLVLRPGYADRYLQIRVEEDRIFIVDGPVWTSAGMTAGLDLALGMVEKDLGMEVARSVAHRLVMQQFRSGGQT